MSYRSVADYACGCGEGPLWHEDEKRLYWCDIPTGRLFRYDPASDTHETVCQGRVVGGFTVQADGSLLLFLDRGTVVVVEDGRVTRTIIEEIPAERDYRFNDVAADPEGRVFCGTMHPKGEGRLYRLDPDGSLHVVLEGVGCSNGIGFSPDGKTMYYTDSSPRTISTFAYDRATGAIRDRKPFASPASDAGTPDGLTVDAEGYVWSARWDGHRVTRYAPDGTEVSQIDIPTSKKISSAMFGGDDFGTLYLTTAGGDDKDANGPDAGALLRIDAAALGGVRGVAEFKSRILL